MRSEAASPRDDLSGTPPEPAVRHERAAALTQVTALSRTIDDAQAAPRARPVLTGLTLTAFAANSLLCRGALDVAGMDAVSFTLVRLASGAAMLLAILMLRARHRSALEHGSWRSGAALLAYALLFSLAYRSIPAGVGALVLFTAVQLTMLTAAVRAGRGPRGSGWFGVALALGGLAVLTLPGAGMPGHTGVLLMAGSGVAWGVYSLRGRGSRDPVAATAGNFLHATLLAVPVCLLALAWTRPEGSAAGIGLAVTSGALASGLGYVLWYAVLPGLGATRAAVLQLAVPVIASLGGAALLGETVTQRLVLASAAVLGGIAWVLRAGVRGLRPTARRRAGRDASSR